MSTQNSQELPSPGLSPAGKSSPNLRVPGERERAQAAASRETRAREPRKPPPVAPILLHPLGPARAHAVSATSTPPVQPVLQRQALLPLRWPQGRRGAGRPVSTKGHRCPPGAPSASPSHPRASASDTPCPQAGPESGPVPQCPDQKRPRRGAQLSTASKWGTGQTPNQRPGPAGERGAWPSSQSLQVPMAAGRAPEWTEAPTVHPGTACLQPRGGVERQGPGPGCGGPSKTPGLDSHLGCSLGPDRRALNLPWGSPVCSHRSAACTST